MHFPSAHEAVVRRLAMACAAVTITALAFPGAPRTAWAIPDATVSKGTVPSAALSWGANSDGQLGDGTTTPRNTPVQVCDVGQTAPCGSFLQDATNVAIGDLYSLAVRSDGTVLAWGNNSAGELGDGTTTPRNTPVQVCDVGQTAPCTSFLTDVIQVAANVSENGVALRSDGTVVTWGFNQQGQLGDGTNTTRNTPVQVCAVGQTAPCTRFLTDVIAIAAGGDQNMALRSDGTVVAWGGNEAGQLGDGTTTPRNTPVQVCAVGQTAPCTSFLTDAVAIAAGGAYSVALRSNGTVVTWGLNDQGQLGDGTNTPRKTPVRVCAVGQTAPCTSFLTNIVEIAATGGLHSLARNSDGTVVSWGRNIEGQLGDGTNTNRNTPVQVCDIGATAPCTSFLSEIVTIAAGSEHSLALHSNSTVVSWGRNIEGELGDGTNTNRNTPVQVCDIGATAPCTNFLTDIVAIAGGDVDSMALQAPDPRQEGPDHAR